MDNEKNSNHPSDPAHIEIAIAFHRIADAMERQNTLLTDIIDYGIAIKQPKRNTNPDFNLDTR